ncbi:MAG: S8 family peptidase [Elusimicrobia bacterium]|nr:S8 family peptidase [Elusimicrobiota bacterium]
MLKAKKLVGMIAGLLALGLLCLAAARAENVSSQQTGPVRRIVAFKDSVPAADRLAIAEASGGQVVRTLELINAVVVEMPAADVRIADSRLKSRPEVLRVDEDPKINWLKAVSAPSQDNVFPDIHAIISPFKPARQARVLADPLPWGVQRVNAPGAWGKTKGQGVKLVVIDTGIDYDHPDLKPVIKGGWNAITKTADFKDDHGHGTHVSGTIAGQGQVIGGTAIWGVAPGVDLYGVKVLDANGSGTFDDVIAGMQWAVEKHMDVASMSLGASQGNASLEAAVKAMKDNNVALIAAAGNSYHSPGEDSVGYPAHYDGAIAIAASDSSDQVASFSSGGPAVALIGPGVSVLSLAPGGGTATMSGTSMATPHNAGLAALAVASGAHGYGAVRAKLTAAATKLKDSAGAEHPADLQGAGLVDAAKLVK